MTGQLDWNAQMFGIYGVAPEDFTHTISAFSRCVHPDDLAYANRRLEDAAANGSVTGVGFRIVRPDGEVRYIDASASALYNDAGKLTGLIGINIDITERKLAEQIALEKERLTASLQLEKEHIATIQHIIATLTHEVKTPLTVIQTTKETLSRYFDRINPDQRQEKLHTIGKQLEYVAELLNDLTLVTGTTLTGRALRLAPTNLEALCQIAAHDVQVSIGRQHRVHFQSDGQVQVVEVDAVLINRILLNLLSNAVKYSQTGSDVWLELNRRERWIVLRVIDQGRGISPDELDRIYEPFYRVDATRSIQGTGLGLSIVKDCVARHNGQISVESMVGHGTTFTVQLPLDHSNGGHE